MIRYYGYYSNKSRGIRKKRGEDKDTALRIEAADLSSREYRRRWASLIKKIYEIDPLVCPDCGGHMQVISFIQDRQIIDKILNHLGLIDECVHSPPQEAAPTGVTYEPFYDDLPSWEYRLSPFPLDYIILHNHFEIRGEKCVQILLTRPLWLPHSPKIFSFP